MKLILTPLQKAIASLKEAIDAYQIEPSNLFVRDSCIQRFEYTYELSWKMLKRYLKLSEPSSENIEELNFQSLIRLGSDRGLLQNGWDKWKVYREARNITSHAYNEEKAKEIISYISDFHIEAQFLLEKLLSAND